MNEKDEQAFEKWWEENIDGPNANYVFLKPSKKLFADAWRGACYYMRNRSPLDPVSLYDKLERERERSEILVEALEKLSLYVSHNGDTWVKERATEALKKYRGE